MTVLAILCARMGSDRLPGKVMADLGGKPVLGKIVDRLNKAKSISKVVIATSMNKEDDDIVRYAGELEVDCCRGSLLDVSDRMNNAFYKYGRGFDYVFRAMADQPYFDWTVFDETVDIMKKYKWDFVLPYSFDTEPIYGVGNSPWHHRVFKRDCASANGEEREHPGMWMRKNIDKFNYGLLDLPRWAYRGHRLELDTMDDLTLFRIIESVWNSDEPAPTQWVVGYLEKNRKVSAINAGVEEKTGTYTSYTRAEIVRWIQDYECRTIVPSQFSHMFAHIQHREDAFLCDCGGAYLVEKAKKGNLILRCTWCKKERMFYSTKQ